MQMQEPTAFNRELTPAAPKTSPSRPDRLRAAVVETGLSLQSTKGTWYAARFLENLGIDVTVAMRVLTRPLARRKQRGE
ncbi:MAG TPA: hypothetical protein VIT92_06500 [Burkholderiaceae bacterium]